MGHNEEIFKEKGLTSAVVIVPRMTKKWAKSTKAMEQFRSGLEKGTPSLLVGRVRGKEGHGYVQPLEKRDS